ncbi:MAG: DUF3775 domain-containing protein [Inquilinaceae bacterium]
MEALGVDTVCYIIAMSREFEVQDSLPQADDDPSNSIDDDDLEVLVESDVADPIFTELSDFIDGLNEDEQCELVALAWLGRGDGDKDGWDDLLQTAEQRHNNRTGAYLLGIPLLPDYLEEGLSQFGLSCEDAEREGA